MPPVPVGSSGGQVGGIPTKYLLIGAGVLGVGAIILMSRRSAPVDTGQLPHGTLGPNAALALGGLETRVMQESGLLQQQLQEYFAQQSGQLGDLSAQIGTGFSDLTTLSQNLAQGLYEQADFWAGQNAAQQTSTFEALQVYLAQLIGQGDANYAAILETWRRIADARNAAAGITEQQQNENDAGGGSGDQWTGGTMPVGGTGPWGANRFAA